MSLYGALYASVSALGAQSNKIGILSDNISNVNTIGYKRNNGEFETLVTNSGAVSTYSPGGVLSSNRQNISQQGLVQGTSSATDVALSGNGFFVVNTVPTGTTGQVMYTRAGSFTQDNLGNFINSAGLYLQGWPLDRSGNLPGVPGNPNTNSSNNLSSLQTVNVQQATGAAAATTSVNISANLLGSQVVYPGASATAGMDRNTVNFAQPGKSIIVPDSINGTQRGDKFTISTGAGLNYTYRYGGFTFSRDIASGATADNGQTVQASTLTLPNSPFSTTNGSKVVTVYSPANGLADGDVVTISGEGTTVGGIPGNELSQTYLVSNVTANSFQITVSTAATSTVANGGDSSVTVQTRRFAGNILDASTVNQALLGTTGTTPFLTSALSFSVTTQASGTVTFNYTSSTPNSQLHQFNTLSNLATAINSVAGLSARVSGGRLYVGALDANAAVTFANGQVQGNSGPPVQAGIDWIRELGLANIAVGDDRFNSLDSLSSIINDSAGLKATINNDLTNATLAINVKDPLDTIAFTDLPVASSTTYTATQPFTMVSGSNVVSVTSPAPNGFKTGDLISLDATGFTGYTPLTLNTGGSSIATTNASTTVTVVTAAAHGFTTGDTIYFDPSHLTGYPNATIGGIPMTDLIGPQVITVVNATTFTITAADAATSTATDTLGAANYLIASQTINGIPIQDLNGTFPITVTGPSTFTIQTTHAASIAGAGGQAGLVVTPPNNSGSILAELGLVASLNSVSLGVAGIQTVSPIGPQYDPANSAKNMAGGTIIPQYSQNVQVYDSLGTGHSLKISFIKTAINTWAAEVYATNPDEVSSTFADGLLTYGTVVFNGDGSLRSVSTGLANPMNIPWTSGAAQGTITIDWGTQGEPFGTLGATQIGGTDGMTQFDAAYKINSINQNGAAVGQLTNVTIDNDGYVIANFNNGQSQKLYQIPIATFSDPDHLTSVSGNAMQQSDASGQPNLRQAGKNGAGKIQASALEASTVDLSTELTDMIIANRAYAANAKLITITDQLLQTLNDTVRG